MQKVRVLFQQEPAAVAAAGTEEELRQEGQLGCMKWPPVPHGQCSNSFLPINRGSKKFCNVISSTRGHVCCVYHAHAALSGVFLAAEGFHLDLQVKN